MQAQYPSLRVMTSKEGIFHASVLERQSRAALRSLLTEMFLLTECEYFVGMF